MPYCFLFGINFLRMNGLSVDVGNERLLKGNREVVRMQKGDVCVADFVGMVRVGVGDEELLSMRDIEVMQEECPMVCELRKCILSGKEVCRWDQMIEDFRVFAKRFVVCTNVVYYIRKVREEDLYVPVFSVIGTVGMALVIHRRYGHMGKFKLWECMKERVFNPWLRKIVNDVATTCEECQKGKYQRMYVKPPVLRMDVNEPFELVVIDCVSLPVTASGYVGMVVMVDHKSKFAYAVPLKNKTSGNVAKVVREGQAFEQMLSDWGIEHVKTTPDMPSSNGLAERTARTLSEMLRMMSERENDWDYWLGKVLWAYKLTVHRATGMSPCMYVLNFEKFVKPRLGLPEGDRDVWRKGSLKFASFKVGDKVLKEVIEKGRLNVSKMREKFEGPYVVKRVMSNGVSYVLEGENDGGMKEFRAHQVQLRPWREPPGYLKIHPVYKFLVNEDDLNENGDIVDDLWLKGKELVLVEEIRKKKRKRGISGNVSKLKVLFNDDNENDEYFSGFWWDNGNNEQSLRKSTYTVCKFPLDERESVLAGLRNIRDRSVHMEVDDLSKFCVELDEVVNVIKANARMREIEKEIAEMSECIPREGSVNEVGETDERAEGGNKPSEQVKKYEKPFTRSRGAVKEYDWVMTTAL